MRRAVYFYRLTRSIVFNQHLSLLCCQEPKIFRHTTFEKGIETRTFSTKLATNGVCRTMNSKQPEQCNLIWIDMEMTGLDPESEHILEVACIVTDGKLNIIAEGPNLVIHQPLNILESMDDWCSTNHKATGLFKASLESEMFLEQAESELLNFVQQHTQKGKCPLAGNTVYMDKFFLLKYMPRFCAHLHYRILDVSSIKLLSKNWYNLETPPKLYKHRALDDIKESIQELIYYRNAIFKPVDLVAIESNQR